MKLVRSTLLALSFGSLLCVAQTTGVQPPPPADPNAPGALHPMPIPRQDPAPVPPGVRTPDVRHPATETDRSRSTGSTKKSGRRAAPAKSKSSTEQAAPAGDSPKAKTEARPQP